MSNVTFLARGESNPVNKMAKCKNFEPVYSFTVSNHVRVDWEAPWGQIPDSESLRHITSPNLKTQDGLFTNHQLWILNEWMDESTWEWRHSHHQLPVAKINECIITGHFEGYKVNLAFFNYKTKLYVSILCYIYFRKRCIDVDSRNVTCLRAEAAF